MSIDQPRSELAALQPLVGEWIEQVQLDGVPAGRMTFAWVLEERYLLQRSEIPDPDFPDSIAIIAPDGAGAYKQHYFDSRGVVRVYKMDLCEGVWTLLRDAPDFTPLQFAQRLTGEFADGGDVIHASWETSPDGQVWEHDFDLTYTKAP
jgi:hypothetical protein